MSRSVSIAFWRKVTTMPPPHFGEEPLDQLAYLLNPIDFSLPDEYQDPAEYNSRVLRSLVNATLLVLPSATVTLADGTSMPVSKLGRKPLYPSDGSSDGILDSRLSVDESTLSPAHLDVVSVDYDLAQAMVADIRKTVREKVKADNLIIRLRTFAQLSDTATSDVTIDAVLKETLQGYPQVLSALSRQTLSELATVVRILSVGKKGEVAKKDIMFNLNASGVSEIPSRHIGTVVAIIHTVLKSL